MVREEAVSVVAIILEAVVTAALLVTKKVDAVVSTIVKAAATEQALSKWINATVVGRTIGERLRMIWSAKLKSPTKKLALKTKKKLQQGTKKRFKIWIIGSFFKFYV